MTKMFNSDPGLYSRYFDPIVREVPVTITIYASTIFVLVQERVANYDHRHSGLYGTNILQDVS
jgi:hypothetical protein